MKKKIIICGFGFMGQTHCANIMQNENASIAAVVDARGRENIKPISGNIKTSAIDWDSLNDIPFFTSLSDCIADCEFAAAVIATPTASHQAMASELLRHGKHIFIEKPLCATEVETQQLLEAAAQTQCVFHVGHCLRFFPEYQYLSSICSKKQYGKLKYLKLVRRTGVPVWGAWKNKDTSLKSITGPVFDLNIHDVDFALKLLGAPKKITAVKERYSEKLFKAYWENSSGTVVEIEGGFAEQSAYPFHSGYTAVFEDAILEYNSLNGGSLILSDNEKSEPVSLVAQDGYMQEINAFIKNICGEKTEYCPAEEAADAVKVCYQIINAL